jgi:dipeptidase
MCDTFIALPSFTNNGSVIFGKNSDREPNEAQDIVHFKRKTTKDKTLKCTYIEIPQVDETFEVILCKPFWMWGAEMGVNEHGVVIGNEAVFTKVKIKKENIGLTGMDLLRLALERTKSAKEALDLIIKLLETYTQNACGGFENKNFFYHNSFIIADKLEAWILETADIHWVSKKLKGFGSISNGLSIQADFDLISENCIAFASKKGWHKVGSEFNFAKSYSDKFMNWASACAIRKDFSTQKGNKNKGNFEVLDAMNILKSHQETNFVPSKSTTKDICMHATGLLSPSHTVGSMVVEIRDKLPATIWLTGTSNPCLSLFKPVYFNTTYSFSVSEAKANGSFWWKSEMLNRKALKNYQELKELTNKAFNNFQKELIEADETLIAEFESEKFVSAATKLKFEELTKKAFDYNEKFLDENKEISVIKSYVFAPIFSIFWKQQNRILLKK